MKMPPKKITVPVFIFILAALVAFISCYTDTKKYENWISTTAIVTDFKVSYSFRGKSRLYKYYYSYSVNGVSFNGYDSFGGGDSKDKTGSTVTIWYNPENHSESTMSTSVSLTMFAPFLVAVPAMIGAYTAFSNSERKQKI